MHVVGWAPLLYPPLQSCFLLLWAFKVARLPEKCIPVAQWASLGTCSVSYHSFIQKAFIEGLTMCLALSLRHCHWECHSCGIHRWVHRQWQCSLIGTRVGGNMGYYRNKQEVARLKWIKEIFLEEVTSKLRPNESMGINQAMSGKGASQSRGSAKTSGSGGRRSNVFGELSMAQTGCNVSVDAAPLPFPCIGSPFQPDQVMLCFCFILRFPRLNLFTSTNNRMPGSCA